MRDTKMMIRPLPAWLRIKRSSWQRPPLRHSGR